MARGRKDTHVAGRRHHYQSAAYGVLPYADCLGLRLFTNGQNS